MIREEIVNQLKQDEGFRPYVYIDSLGYFTIGYGRLVDRKRGGRISVEEATFLLENDIDKCIASLDQRLPWWRDLDDVRQHVLINMCFNLGISGLLGFKNTLAKIRDGKYEDAARIMLKSKWAQQVSNRAKRLAHMMETGI